MLVVHSYICAVCGIQSVCPVCQGMTDTTGNNADVYVIYTYPHFKAMLLHIKVLYIISRKELN